MDQYRNRDRNARVLSSTPIAATLPSFTSHTSDPSPRPGPTYQPTSPSTPATGRKPRPNAHYPLQASFPPHIRTPRLSNPHMEGQVRVEKATHDMKSRSRTGTDVDVRTRYAYSPPPAQIYAKGDHTRPTPASLVHSPTTATAPSTSPHHHRHARVRRKRIATAHPHHRSRPPDPPRPGVAWRDVSQTPRRVPVPRFCK